MGVDARGIAMNFDGVIEGREKRHQFVKEDKGYKPN